MGTILLILFIVFIVVPLVRFYLAVKRTQKHMRDTFQNGQQQQQQSGRKSGWTKAPSRRRKKIDDNVGEYVRFEEIDGSRPNSESNNTSKVETEQQIVDAEWEDIK